MKKWLIIGAGVIVVLIGSFMTVKKVSPVGWGWWGDTNTSDGVGLKGYDPVAYFNSSEPKKGSAEFTKEWEGVTWQFSSSANRDLLV